MATADLVVVRKADRTLELLRDGSIIRTYQISLGGDPVGPKQREGDEKTPEGTYTIDYRKARRRGVAPNNWIEPMWLTVTALAKRKSKGATRLILAR